MGNISPASGWQWIRQGFALFRRQPAEMSTLFVLYVFVTGILSLIPLIGPILRFLLAPAFSMAFMQACADIEADKRVYPRILFAGLRLPSAKSLAKLGVLYLLAALLALLVTNLMDGGAFWDAINSSTAPDQKAVEDSHLVGSTMCAVGVYFAISLLLWFAAPLIAWQNMSVGKAVFYSVFTVARAIKAFFVYCLAWLAIGMFLLLLLSTLLSALIADMQTEVFILLPFAMLIMVVVHCSFYPSYVQIFGAHQPPQPPEQPQSPPDLPDSQ